MMLGPVRGAGQKKQQQQRPAQSSANAGALA